jgi:hypothetical protein
MRRQRAFVRLGDDVMILDIVGASASWNDNKLHVAFDVVPEESSHIDLKTGEIFQSSSYAWLRKREDKAISATLFVTSQGRNAAGTELPSEMRYVPGKGERSSINLIWRLPDDHLAGFHDLVLAGKMPRQAVVFFQHGELEFGWEPDGSGQKWDNEKTPAVLIENVRFDLSLQVSPVDRPWNEKVPDHYYPAFFSDAAKVNFALVRKLSAIESSMGRLSWIVGLIALLMLVLVLSRFSH